MFWPSVSFFLTTVILTPALTPTWRPYFSEIQAIENQIRQLEDKIDSLPVCPINSSPWTLGYSSTQSKAPDLPVVIETVFPSIEVVDLIALLPASYTNDNNEITAFGFPLRFTIERILSDGTYDLVADHSEKDFLDPNIGPLLFPCPKPIPIKGIRITATKLNPNPTWWPASHVFALSELLAFKGKKNVALGSLTTASSSLEFSYMWGCHCLTDGFSLFSPIDHKLSNPQKNFATARPSVVLNIDLKDNHFIDELRLWPVAYTQHNFPILNGIGFPRKILLEGSNKPDFSDSKILLNRSLYDIRSGAGPLMERISPSSARYLKLTLADGAPDFRRSNQVLISMSEIEFLQDGENLSLGLKPTTTSAGVTEAMLEKLTDGISNEGKILPLRQWMTQFSEMLQAKDELLSLSNTLEVIKKKDARFSELSLLLAIVIVVFLLGALFLIKASTRKRWSKMREQIACDLHDEVGANLSSIAHTAELLDETITTPSTTQNRLLSNLIKTARITSRETKNFISFVEGETLSHDLHHQFNKVANQILCSIPYTTNYQNSNSFNRLTPDTKWSLILFTKEALNNVIKHSRATNVEISTLRKGASYSIIIKDNGIGLPEGITTSSRLSQRSRKLKGSLAVTSKHNQGTIVSLTFKK